jgi:glycine cleavage system H protein
MKILEGLYYTKDHEWVRMEDKKAYIGITDYAQHSLGSIVFVELPEVDAHIKKGDGFAVIESVKAASDVYAPLSGKVVLVHDALIDHPEWLNEDPYKNWLICLEEIEEDFVQTLMDSTAYSKLTNKE